ncbi:DUF6193 family natural product biosynthesis protein [Nocardia sp. NPDC057030]|uniref:DUF6193 family natural product biosynthesis protein n=1 Tax=unclassified Nocardia TaxID=2637762 RepID=UPI00364245A2
MFALRHGEHFAEATDMLGGLKRWGTVPARLSNLTCGYLVACFSRWHTGVVFSESLQRLLPWYPELESADNLLSMLQTAIDSTGFDVIVLPAREQDKRFVSARIDDGIRSLSIDLDTTKRAFVMRFRAYGVLMAGGTTSDLAACAAAAVQWQSGTTSWALYKAWSFVEYKEFRAQADEHDPVAARWAFLRTQRPDLDHRLIEAAYAQPRLRMLFPATSVSTTLILSRCTRYPFSFDVPSVCSTGGKYYVLRGRYMPEGPKTIAVVDMAEDAVALAVAHLPEGCGPAIIGTYQDLDTSTPSARTHL